MLNAHVALESKDKVAQETREATRAVSSSVREVRPREAVALLVRDLLLTAITEEDPTRV